MNHTDKWGEAADRAQDELNQLNRRIRQLRKAIQTFLDNKKNNVPWPDLSDVAATQNQRTTARFPTGRVVC